MTRPSPTVRAKAIPCSASRCDVCERIAAGEHDRDHGVAAVGGECQVTARQRRVEGVTDQRPAGAKVLRPGNDVGAELLEHARLETVQATRVHEIQRQRAEAESRAIVAEMRSEHQGEMHVGKARGVAVAMLQAEIRHAAHDEPDEMRIGGHRRSDHLGEHVHRRVPVGIAHQRQVDERLDRTVPELLPDPRVFLSQGLDRRVRRPVDAGVPQVVETNVDGAIGAIQRGVEHHA